MPQVSPASLFGGKSSSSSSRRGVKSPNDNTHALDETQRLLKHLRKLYQAMGEADVTLALTEATATSHEACDAVRAELNNDFSTALKTFVAGWLNCKSLHMSGLVHLNTSLVPELQVSKSRV